MHFVRNRGGLKILIPWPVDALGEYGASTSTSEEMDAWVHANLVVPEDAAIVGIGAGRKRDGDPIIQVAIKPSDALEDPTFPHISRNAVRTAKIEQSRVNEEAVKIHPRIPIDLHQKLVASAERNHRSLNAELLYRLESTFEE